MNLYAYAGNNPISFNDPFGLCPWCIGAVLGAAVSGAVQVGANLAQGRPATDQLGRALLVGAVVGGTLGAAAPEATAALGARVALGGATGIATGGAAAGGAGGNALFQNGQRIQQVVQTKAGDIEVGFRVAVDGAKLHLSELSVFPETGGTANLGTGQVLSAMRQLFDAAKAQGFEQIRITGYRISGADPGHVFDVTKDLTH